MGDEVVTLLDLVVYVYGAAQKHVAPSYVAFVLVQLIHDKVMDLKGGMNIILFLGVSSLLCRPFLVLEGMAVVLYVTLIRLLVGAVCDYLEQRQRAITRRYFG